MKVLIIPSWYPEGNDNLLGIYHKEFASAISNNGVLTNMIYISRIGLSDILKYPFMKKKEIDDEKTYKVYKYKMLDLSKISIKLQLKKYEKKLDKCYKDYLKTNDKPDLIHAMVTLPAGYGSAILKKKYNIPVLVTEHSSNYYQYFKGDNKPFGDYVLNNTLFSTVSNYMKKELNLDKCEVIPNIIDTKVFDVKRSKKGSTLRLVTVSAFRNGKNLEHIIKALALLVNRGIKDIHLDMVGDGYLMNYLKETAKELKLSEYITFTGKTKNKEEVAEHLSKNDIFVVASARETFCIPGVEALASGMPIVSSKCLGPEEYIDEKCGELFTVGNIEEFADAIIKVNNKLDSYDKKYLKSIANRYSYKTVADLTISIYKDMLKHI